MVEELNDSDLSENEEQYSKLAEAISQLDNTRRVKGPERKELSTVVSEFHLQKKNDKRNIVNVTELANVLKNKSATQDEISKKVKAVIKKARTLPKPLEAPVAERIKRTVGYENVKGHLKKWNAIVAKNRVAEQLSFPLKQGRVSLQNSHQFLNKFKPTTPLEIEMAKILGTEVEEPEDEEDKEKNLEFPLTFEEMMEKKKELAKIRAKLSYQEAKAHRQSKIKSKKYHRILKREKIKQQLKEFEQLQKTDPEAALKKLEELDKTRARERASLRHKSTGKWARNAAVRAKYDKESRKVLAEQLKLSRDLTAKVKNIDSEEEADDHEIPLEEPKEIVTKSDNPWALNVSAEVSEFYTTCKSYWENKNKEKEKKLKSVENESSQKVTTGDNVTNGITKSNESSIGMINSANDGTEINHLDVASTLTNKVKNKNENLVNQKKLGNGECKKSDESAVVVESTNKSKKLKKKSKNLDDNKAEKQKKLQQFDSPEQNKLKKIKKKKGKTEAEELISNNSTSGVWAVSEATAAVEGKNPGKRKNVEDIDDLFDDLDEKIASKTSKKLKRIKKNLINKGRKARKVAEVDKEDVDDDIDDLEFKNRSNQRPDADEELDEITGQEPSATNGEIPINKISSFDVSESNAPAPDIDPNKFIQVKPKKLNTKLPDNLTGEDADFMDDDEDARNAQQMNIVEAFGDDDVVEEFQEMKKEEEENTKLKAESELPGWGCWGGADIKPTERKTKRNMMNAPKLPQRKDKNKKDLIIREKTDPKLLEHMVKDIPHPFKSVGAFESNLRHPLGREWIPETAHRKLVMKPVETLLGTIIEPMDKSDLLRLSKQEKSLYRGKQKKK